MDNFFLKVENYKAPSTILFRSIELKLLKKTLNKYLKSKLVLDLGCGDGISSECIFEQKVYLGLDNEIYFVKKARERKIYRKVILADAKQIPLKNKSLDLVFSNSVIEHIPDADRVIKEVARVLKKGGYFIFTSPSDNLKKYSVFSWLKIKWLAKIYGEKREVKFNHFHCYSLEKWKKLLKKEGLQFIEGYCYIDKETAELWDFLLVFFYFLEKINIKFKNYVYNRFFREKIYKRFKKSKKIGLEGSAICIVVKKI